MIPWSLIAPSMMEIVLSGHEMTFPGGINMEDGTTGRDWRWYSGRIELGHTF